MNCTSYSTNKKVCFNPKGRDAPSWHKKTRNDEGQLLRCVTSPSSSFLTIFTALSLTTSGFNFYTEDGHVIKMKRIIYIIIIIDTLLIAFGWINWMYLPVLVNSATLICVTFKGPRVEGSVSCPGILQRVARNLDDCPTNWATVENEEGPSMFAFLIACFHQFCFSSQAVIRYAEQPLRVVSLSDGGHCRISRKAADRSVTSASGKKKIKADCLLGVSWP